MSSNSFAYGFLDELQKLAAAAANGRPGQQQGMLPMPPSATAMKNQALLDEQERLQLMINIKQLQAQARAMEEQEAMQQQMDSEQAYKERLAQMQQQDPEGMGQGPGGVPDGPIDPREMIGG